MRAYALLLLLSLPLRSAVIGRSTPAEPLTVQRIQGLRPDLRNAWMTYLRRSEAQMQADRTQLAREREGLTQVPPLPEQGSSGRAIPVNREPAFYRSEEARRLGDIILSFQTPAGGWSKNLAMTAPRTRGQSYATANLAPVASSAGDFDTPRDEHWHYVGTLDNDATTTELHFLAALAAALPGHEGDVYRASFLHGVEYLLKAQYPNGGWPQVWPLEGGYHDAITFNDNAVLESMELLQDVSHGGSSVSRAAENFQFVPAELRKRAAAAVARALQCILQSQVRVPAPEGRGPVLTVWSQQVDMLTLAPVAARNFEPAALSAGESASLLEYLMSLPHPSASVVGSIDAAAAWFEAHKIMGYTWSGGRNTPGGRMLKAVEGAGPLWPRFSSLSTGQPIFGDRDKTIHDDVMEISLERRNGYAWYTQEPERVLKDYVMWNEARADGCFGARFADASVRKDVPCKH